MPRYFFHVADGACIRDADGDELSGLAEAQWMAIQVMAEMLPGQRPDLIPQGELKVVVTDAEGRSVWSISVATGTA